MNELNEALQWAALLFIGVFVVGLTRQLGAFMTHTRQDKAALEGPPVGSVAPPSLIRPEERTRIADLMAERGTDWAGLVTVSESCESCEEYLDALPAEGIPEGAPLIIMSNASSEEHRRRLSALGDLVVVDGRRMRRSRIEITPFCIIVDRDFVVVKKGIAADFAALCDSWRADIEEAEAAESESAVVVTANNGRGGVGSR